MTCLPPRKREPFEASPGRSHPAGALQTPAPAGSACAPAHPATGTSTIQLGVHNSITCCVKKYFPPVWPIFFLPDNFIGCSLLHPSVVSSVWGEMSGVYLLCAKCLAEVVEHFGSLSPGILASAFPQLSQEREKPPKNEVPGCSQLFSPFT